MFMWLYVSLCVGVGKLLIRNRVDVVKNSCFRSCWQWLLWLLAHKPTTTAKKQSKLEWREKSLVDEKPKPEKETDDDWKKIPESITIAGNRKWAKACACVSMCGVLLLLLLWSNGSCAWNTRFNQIVRKLLTVLHI